MTTKKGVWNLQQVRDKKLQDLWGYTTSGDAAKLFVWGGNERGTLGLSEALGVNKDSPVQIPGTTWVRIAKGGYMSKRMLATKSDGTLWSWGDNQYGQLGQNDITSYSSPIQIPGTTWALVQIDQYDTYATKTDGTLWAWGRNLYGELGQNNRTTYSSPKQVGSDTTWPTSDSKISSHSRGILAIKTDGTLWTWGANSQGALGLNESGPASKSSPVQIPGSWSYLSNGMMQNGMSGAINTDGELFMWGNNTQGNLGHNNAVQYSSPVQVPGTWNGLGGGAAMTFATRSDGTIWSWGYNVRGQLGLSDQIHRSSPTQIPGTTWSAGGQASSTSLTTGFTKTDGTLWTVGQGQDYGLLGAGLGVGARRSSPVQVGSETDWNTGYGSISMTYENGYAMRSL